jgi:hypothetical protein
MQVGQKVVCVDDRFPGPLAKYYVNLPVKGKTYTIRAVYLGRAVMHTKAGAADGEIGGQELGFNSMRFRPLEEDETSEAQEQEEEWVGANTNSESWKQ